MSEVESIVMIVLPIVLGIIIGILAGFIISTRRKLKDLQRQIIYVRNLQ